MATIYRRGKDFVSNFTIKGRRFRVKLSQDKKTARLQLSDMLLKAERGELGLEQVLSNAVSAINNFLRHTLASHRPTTHARYKASLEHFQRFLSKEGVFILNDITTEHIERFKEWRKTTQTGKKRLPKTRTINVELTVLKAFFSYTIRIGKLDKSPANGVRPLKEDDLRPRRFLNDSESQSLLESCDADCHALIFFLLNTGTRLGEAVNLEWEDIDLEKKIVHVRAKTFWKPKCGERQIPLTASTIEVLRKIPKEGRFVFSATLLPRHKNWVGRKLKRAAQRAGIFGLRVHDLRHSFASRCVANGVSVFALKKILGHTEIETTSLYVHTTPSQLAGEMEKVSLPVRAQASSF